MTITPSAWALLSRALAALALLAGLTLSLPEFLATPGLRPILASMWLSAAMLACATAAAAIAITSLLRGRGVAADGLAVLASFSAVALIVGAADQPAPAVSGFYVGLDWLLLDLLASALIFLSLERAFALRPLQPLLRPFWRTDLGYFAVNHLVAGVVLLLAHEFADRGLGWLVSPTLKASIGELPMWAAVPLILLLADMIQYWVHRAYHRVPILWRIHRVHHSCTTMDWLAGSRQHVFELFITRSLGLAPLFALGFDKVAMDVAIVFALMQAVLNHANVEWPRTDSPLRALRFVFVTPHFHHWHHAREGADNANFAALFSFLDRLFGTACEPLGRWPESYGVRLS